MDEVDDTAAQLGYSSGGGVEDSKSCLVLCIDLHSDGWLQYSQAPLWDVLANLLVLANAHLALASGNGLAVIGYNGLGARLLYSTIDHRPTYPESVKLKGSMIRQFKHLDESVLAGIHQQLQDAAKMQASKCTTVSGPLSLALSYLNRQISSYHGLRGHILVVTAEPDNLGLKYINTMNSIFTAQKLQVPVDVANFGPSKSFLQQAADFTGGSYLELGSVDACLIAIFASSFLVDPAVRRSVNLATRPDVDFSTVCFTTKKVVEIGYVCSVCLCIMESIPSSQHCPVCNANYTAA